MKLFIILIVLLLAAIRAEAQTWYVNGTTGNNANNCTAAQDPTTPKQTISNALDNCFSYGAGAGANRILEIAGGTYPEALNRFFNWPKGSSWNAPFTMRGAAGATVIIRPTSSNQGAVYFHDNDLGGPFYLIMQNITIDKSQMTGEDNAVNVFASHVRLDRVTIHSVNWGCGILAAGNDLHITNSTIRNGTYNTPVTSTGGANCYPVYSNGANVIIENSTFHTFPRYGLHIYKDGGCPVGTIIRNNTIYNNNWSSDVDPAILVCGNNHQVYNNLIYNVHGGIDGYIQTGQTGVQIYNNTVYNMDLFGIAYNSAGITARNNILYNTAAKGIPTYPAAGHSGYFWNSGGKGALTASHNLCGHAGCVDMVNGGTVGTTTTITGDPRFADAANGDFELQSNSPALLAGQNLTSLGIAGLLTDAVGIVRPAPPTLWTIGALQGGAPPSGPIVTITSPTIAPNYAVTSATFALSGTASSGVAVSKVTWACPTCTPTSGTATGTTSWSITGITLALGNNVITVTATDNNAQTANDVITVNYLAQGLVYAAGFDEASGTSVLDASGNGNTGTLGGGVTRVAGVTGGALFFDGTVNGVLTVPDSNPLDLASGYTISAYLSPSELAANTWRAFLTKYDNYWFYVTSGHSTCPNGDKPYGGFDITGSGYQALCSGVALPTAAWTFVTFRYDGATQSIYFGTTLVASRTSSGFIPSNANDLLVGNSPYDEGFKGFMDRLRIYNYAIPLTAGKNSCSDSPSITRDMNCPIGAAPVISIKLNVTSLKVGPSITRKWGFGP